MAGPSFFKRWRARRAARAGAEDPAQRRSEAATCVSGRTAPVTTTTPGCGDRAKEVFAGLCHRARNAVRSGPPRTVPPSPTVAPLLRASSQESDMMTADSTQTESSSMTELVSVASQTPPELSQTDPVSEHPPLIQYQERSALRAQHNLVSQADTNLYAIAAGAVAIANLQSSVASAQWELQLLRLRVLPLDEDRARGDVQLAADDEWAAMVRDFHAAGPLLANSKAAIDVSDDVPQAQRARECTLPRSTELSFPEPTGARSPSFARECLFIDNISHWVATFVRRDWALVCSTSAQAVYDVLHQVQDIWAGVTFDLGKHQSLGSNSAADNRHFGPEPGMLFVAKQRVLDLHQAVVQMEAPARGLRWRNRFTLHMAITANFYDEMRLRHRQVYYEARNIVADLVSPLDTLWHTLNMRNARVAAERLAEGGSADGDGPT